MDKSVGYIVLAVLTVTAVIAIIIYHIIKTNERLKRRLADSIGKPPEDVEYEFESIGKYFYYKNNILSNSKIDDITWNDLDMDKVFSRINICLTSVGEEYLYDCLHNLKFDEAPLVEREAFISYLKNNPDERLKIQLCLHRMGKSNYSGLSSLILNTEYKSFKYTFIYKILAFIPLACIALIFFNASAGIFFMVLSFIINMAVYYLSRKKIATEIAAIRYFTSMLICCDKICNIKQNKTQPLIQKLNKYFTIFKSLAGNMSGIMQIPVTDAEFIFEYFKILFLFDIRNYNKSIKKIIKNSDDCHNLYKILGEIEVSLCVLSFRESLPFYTKPIFHDNNIIIFNDVFHPLLSSPVPNSGTINNSSIITGSNASGKTTFIKALAINGILAQTLYTCAANEYRLKFSLVITSMALRDSILDGDSYFIVEIKSLKRIFDNLETINCTCFIDEILRGTNTIERIAASAAVLRYLREKNCLCLVASHDIELTHLLENLYDNYNFCEQITDEGLLFDYKLKNGVSKTRNAIKLLSYMDFDKSIIENAEQTVKLLEEKNIKQR